MNVSTPTQPTEAQPPNADVATMLADDCEREAARVSRAGRRAQDEYAIKVGRIERRQEELRVLWHRQADHQFSTFLLKPGETMTVHDEGILSPDEIQREAEALVTARADAKAEFDAVHDPLMVRDRAIGQRYEQLHKRAGTRPLP